MRTGDHPVAVVAHSYFFTLFIRRYCRPIVVVVVVVAVDIAIVVVVVFAVATVVVVVVVVVGSGGVAVDWCFIR